MAESRLERDGAPLRESREDDLRRRDPARLLAHDQRLEARLRGAHARRVLAPHALERVDVVPGTHDRAAVDRHRLHRRVREDEAHARRLREIERGDDRLEVVTVGAEPVEPDDARLGPRRRLDLERFEQAGHDDII